jgi:hypothetical protein
VAVWLLRVWLPALSLELLAGRKQKEAPTEADALIGVARHESTDRQANGNARARSGGLETELVSL